MNTIADLHLERVFLDPRHLVSTARHVLSGHSMRVVGVMDGEKLVGTLSVDQLLRAPDNATIAAYVEPIGQTVQIADTVRAVGSVFALGKNEYLPALDHEAYAGIVTPLMVIPELGKSYDPMTKLCWSDELRSWGVDNLKSGCEITILFIDLDSFRAYNKKHGHKVGDRVIEGVAEFLRSHTDQLTDLLVRYAGDEFAIGTVRTREEAESLVAQLKAGLPLSVEGVPEKVSFSLGLYGGRRTRERENTHFAATVDNLINRASQECLASKVPQSEVPEQPTLALVETEQDEPSMELIARPPVEEVELEEESSGNLTVAGVYIDDLADNGVTTVILTDGSKVISGADSRNGKAPLISVAQATLKALERHTAPVRLFVEEIVKQNGKVFVRSRAATDSASAENQSSVRIISDLYQSAAEATIKSTLRAARKLS